jgi:hypothetical protein
MPGRDLSPGGQNEKRFAVGEGPHYLDGKKHVRQTPWGAKLQTLASWNGDQLVIVTEGKELAFVIQLDIKGFESTVVARHYRDRKAGQ